MKTFLISALIVYSMLFFSSQSRAWEIAVDDFMGAAVYEEEANSAGVELKSDWKAFLNKATFSAADYDNNNLEGEVRFGIPITPGATESWDINSIEFQTNDMSLWGIDTGVALGWAFPVKIGEDSDMALTPLVGYRWKFIRFTRSNFNILNTITIAETVDEDFNIHSLDLGGKVTFTFDKFEIFTKPIFGIVLYNAADNSALGTVEGDGGWLLNLDAGINYAISKDIMLGLMLRTELQYLDGGTAGNVIWPDNRLNIYGGKVSLTYRF